MPSVGVRRAAACIATFVVAIVVALAVPVSQLRTVSVILSCCCPDPASCHCPDHNDDVPAQPEMRACHNTQQSVVAPQLPAFHAPAFALTAAPARVVVALDHAVPAPHPAPPPARPDAPS